MPLGQHVGHHFGVGHGATLGHDPVDRGGHHPVVRAEHHSAERPAGTGVHIAAGQRDGQRHLGFIARNRTDSGHGLADPVGQGEFDLRGQGGGGRHPCCSSGTMEGETASQRLLTQLQAWISRKPHTDAMPLSAHSAITASGSGSAAVFTQAGK